MSHLGAGSSFHLPHILVTHVSHGSHPGYPPSLWPIGAHWCREVRTHIIIDSLSQESWSAMKHNELKCPNYPWHGLWHFSAFSAGWHYPGPVWSPWHVNTRGPGSLAGASRSVTQDKQYDDRPCLVDSAPCGHLLLMFGSWQGPGYGGSSCHLYSYLSPFSTW